MKSGLNKLLIGLLVISFIFSNVYAVGLQPVRAQDSEPTATEAALITDTPVEPLPPPADTATTEPPALVPTEPPVAPTDPPPPPTDPPPPPTDPPPLPTEPALPGTFTPPQPTAAETQTPFLQQPTALPETPTTIPTTALGISETPIPTSIPIYTLPPSLTQTIAPGNTPIASTTTLAVNPAAPGSYDDQSGYIRYSGSWLQWETYLAFQNGTHFSNTPGSTAEMSFYGVGIDLIYASYPDIGIMRIEIDGTAIADLNQFKGQQQSFANRWSSPELANSYHTLRLTHLSGALADIDAIIIRSRGSEQFTSTPAIATNPALPTISQLLQSPAPSQPPSLTPIPLPTNTPIPVVIANNTPTPTPGLQIVSDGFYDDTSPALRFSGEWIRWNNSGAIDGGTHYSAVPGSFSELQFIGNGIDLVYTNYSGAGIVRIVVDGVSIADLDQSLGSAAFKNTWSSTAFAQGSHTLTIFHLSGAFVDLDGVFVRGETNSTPTYPLIPSPTTQQTETLLPSLILSATVTPSQTTQTPMQTRPTRLSGLLGSSDQSTPIPSPTGTIVPLPLAIGTYDDKNSYIKYNGRWREWYYPYAYLAGTHFSDTIGDAAVVAFYGSGIDLLYSKYTGIGTIQIKIDDTPVADLDQSTATNDFQNRWTSPYLTLGYHIAVFTHLSGSYVDFDAITIRSNPTATPTVTTTRTPTRTMTNTITSGPSPTATQTLTLAPVGYGTYDDQNQFIRYSGDWTRWNSPQAYLDGTHYSSVTGNMAELAFYGSGVDLFYSSYQNVGVMRIEIDGVVVANLNQNTGGTSFKNRWISAELTSAYHSVRFTHLSGSFADLDAIVVRPAATITPTITLTKYKTQTSTPTRTPINSPTTLPAPEGTYDDQNGIIQYGGSWVRWSNASAYLGGTHYSNTIGSTAAITFSGSGIDLMYSKYSGIGVVSVTIDGTLVGTLDQNTGSANFKNLWSSPTVPTGVHSVVFTHISGASIDLDAIIVRGLPTRTPTPLGPTRTQTITRTSGPTITPSPTNTLVPLPLGKYDNKSPYVRYTGSWVQNNATSAYLGSTQYSELLGDTATVTFNGTGIDLIFSKYSGVGTVRIIIDGSFVADFDQSTAAASYQNSWSSPAYAMGVHTAIFTHQVGSYIDLDAVVIRGAPTLTPTLTRTRTPTGTRTQTVTVLVTKTITSTPTLQSGAAGTHDDSSLYMRYSGSWVRWSNASAYNGGTRYSTTIGSSVEFRFYGTGVDLLYSKYPNVGVTRIAIDGIPISDLNQSTGGSAFLNRWSSPSVALGHHSVTFTHLSGTYTDFDAVIVRGASTPTRTPTRTFLPLNTSTLTPSRTPTRTPTKTLTPTATRTLALVPGAGVIDDLNANIRFTGSWTRWVHASNYNGGAKYSKVIGSIAELSFSGTGVDLVYPSFTGIGVMRIDIDGAFVINLTQLNGNTFRNRWSSGPLAPGTHTVKFTHLSGQFASLDFIEVH